MPINVIQLKLYRFRSVQVTNNLGTKAKKRIRVQIVYEFFFQSSEIL